MKTVRSKTAFFLYLLLTGVLVQGCSSPASLCQSRWQDKPVTIDGKLKEWTVPLDFVDKDTKLNYVISNDDSNLYYWIRITDDKEQIRFMRAGIQFWIDTTGKNQKQVGVMYPFTQLNSADTSIKESKKWTGKLNQMSLTGFHKPIRGIISLPNNYGIRASIGRDSTGVTLYEACIPFRTFYRPLLTAADNNKQLGVTIIINPLPTPPPESSARAHGGDAGGYEGPGGMGMGYPGGGMDNYRAYHKGADDDYNLQSATLKIALRLSAK